MTAETLRRYEAPLLDPRTPSQAHWEGWLTLDNLEAVADRIRAMLAGQRYTFVAVNGLFGDCPEVRTGNALVGGVRVSRHDGFGGVTWSDSRYVTGLHTFVQTQDEARHLAEDDEKRKRLTRVTLDPSFRDPGTLLTEQWTGAGHRLYWVVAVEHEAREPLWWRP